MAFFLRDSEKYFPYPIVYEDGLISNLKSDKENRKVWGFIYKKHIISIYAEKMSPKEAREFCKKNIFAGKNYCIVPRAIMKKILQNTSLINSLIKELGGTLIKSQWYMAANDRWLDKDFILDKKICGVHPLIKPVRNCCFIDEETDAYFYPAIVL